MATWGTSVQKITHHEFKNNNNNIKNSQSLSWHFLFVLFPLMTNNQGREKVTCLQARLRRKRLKKKNLRRHQYKLYAEVKWIQIERSGWHWWHDLPSVSQWASLWVHSFNSTFETNPFSANAAERSRGRSKPGHSVTRGSASRKRVQLSFTVKPREQECQTQTHGGSKVKAWPKS